MALQDFLLDDNGDLLIQNGDFAVGPSDPQHVEDIIESFAGWWKQFPQVGVGLIQYLNSQNGRAAVNAIKQQLQADGYTISNVSIKQDPTGPFVVSFPQGIERA